MFSLTNSPSRRKAPFGLPYMLLLALTFALSTLSNITLATGTGTGTLHRHTRRDAFTRARGTIGDKVVKDVGPPPAGAYARPLDVTRDSQIFTWYSKTPEVESEAEAAFIVIHGVKRNAGSYWTILNNAWAKARDAQFGSAYPNSIRVAPLFFSTEEDKGAYNATQLGWGDSNAWTAGEGSTHPLGSNVCSFSVLDMLVNRFSDARAYPKMKVITLVAHGGGAQMLQRYAVLAKAKPDTDRLSVRYVIGDPSSELYFTRDRPVGVDQASCPAWNDYRYGFEKSSIDYTSLSASRAPALFKAYAAKEVRYVVGLADNSTKKGDQTCMAHAVGGDHRSNRSLAYWKYIQLLSGTSTPDQVRNFPGTFPALDPKYGATTQSNIPTSSRAVLSKFMGVRVRHSLTVVQGAGHSASKVYGSPEGRNALFATQATSGSGTVPDLSRELDGYTADAAGAKDYSKPDASEEDDESAKKRGDESAGQGDETLKPVDAASDKGGREHLVVAVPE